MKSVLITGASGGLGLALAELYISRGFRVITLSRSGSSCKGAENYCVDLAKFSSIRDFLAMFLKKESRLDVLVNNCGISPVGRIMNFSEEEFNKTIMVNFVAVKMLIEGLKETLLGGSVVNIVSRVGFEGRIGLCGYAASKGLLNGYIKGAAGELLRSGITISGVNPGFMITGMVQEKTIDKQKGESELGVINSTKASAEFVFWVSGLSWVSGQILDFDSRVYRSW